MTSSSAAAMQGGDGNVSAAVRASAAAAQEHRFHIGPADFYDVLTAIQFNLLTALGLREKHFLVDIGCGSLRAGRLLIPYLASGHYFGIEPLPWLIQEGVDNEIGEAMIRIKRPQFRNDENF